MKSLAGTSFNKDVLENQSSIHILIYSTQLKTSSLIERPNKNDYLPCGLVQASLGLCSDWLIQPLDIP